MVWLISSIRTNPVAIMILATFVRYPPAHTYSNDHSVRVMLFPYIWYDECESGGLGQHHPDAASL
jgi:hypothetical protein